MPLSQLQSGQRGCVHCSRDQPPEDEILVGGRGLDNCPLVPFSLRNQREQHGQDAAADWKNAPHKPLPTWRNLRRVHWHCWWHVLFAPHADRLIFKVIHLAPASKDQERLVVGVPYEYPFQA